MKKTIALILVFCMIFSSVAMAEPLSTGEKIKKIVSKAGDTIVSIVEKFSDMKDHWSTQWVEELLEKDVISGYLDGTFKPDRAISRSEFTKLLIVAQGEDPGVFEGGHWAKNYIEKAMKEGYIESGEFADIDKNITRAEMARMIARAMEEEPENWGKYKNNIADFEQISTEYREYVLRVYAAGIVKGLPGGTFSPQKTASRAEASTMLVKLLDTDEREIPEVVEEPKIVIDGEEIAVERKDTVVVFNQALSVFDENDNFKLVYNNHDTVSIFYMPEGEESIYENILCFYSDTDEGTFEHKFDNNIVVNSYTDETKKITKDILKKIYPKGYEKIYKQFIEKIDTGEEVSGKSDGRTYRVKSWPTETSISIGGK
ncbi:S-layer homology domain-containing protein [Clostridiisalibacter paucivorans]|uniref:S-layer homology domain-containing protein n=1 Tax=Clostridiisalibacter paucivorans TaxID=408753 RepID=UPI0004788581|nr:S-layer homology domain-containing protein [Clostridiisalibacter paucivorans]